MVTRRLPLIQRSSYRGHLGKAPPCQVSKPVVLRTREIGAGSGVGTRLMEAAINLPFPVTCKRICLIQDGSAVRNVDWKLACCHPLFYGIQSKPLLFLAKVPMRVNLRNTLPFVLTFEMYGRLFGSMGGLFRHSLDAWEHMLSIKNRARSGRQTSASRGGREEWTWPRTPWFSGGMNLPRPVERDCATQWQGTSTNEVPRARHG